MSEQCWARLGCVPRNTWALAFRKCLFWGWHSNLGEWMNLTAQIGGRNTWTSLEHCLGTWPDEIGMTDHEAHLVTWKGQFYWGQVRRLANIPRHMLPRMKSKMIFLTMTRGAMWSFPPSLVSFPLPIFIVPRTLVKIFNHQYGSRTNQSEEMQGLMTLSAPSECHFCIALWLLSKAHFMCATPRVHCRVLCFQINVHTAAYWTVVSQTETPM